jgi:hypothetical protein
MISGHDLDMRQKISTLVDPGLYRRVKLESVRRNKQISEIVGEALESYLATGQPAPTTAGVVAESWGALRFPREHVERILSEEASLLDA